MNLRDLFKTKRRRERERARRARRAFSEARSSVKSMKDRASSLKRDRDKAWEEAKEYLRNGQRSAAQRQLQSWRAAEVLGTKVEMKRWVSEQLLTKMEMAESDQDVAQAFTVLTRIMKIDPEQVDNVFQKVQDLMSDQLDADNVWEEAYRREMVDVENLLPEAIPSIDELEKQLSDEVAAAIGSEQTVVDSENDGGGSQDRIAEGRKRLKELLESDT